MPQVPIPVRELEVTLSFLECDAGAGWICIPDAIEVDITHRSGEWQERWSSTCLENLFRLLDQLKCETSGWVPFGTGVLPVEFDADAVRLRGRRELIGTPAETRSLVRDLIAATFEELDRDDGRIEGYGQTTRNVAETIADGRLTFDAIDPVAVHDELTA